MTNKNSIRPVIFYGNTLRAFRTTLIWYLYEVCQKYECVLIISEMDQQTLDFLNAKQNFPGLKRIIVQECTNHFDKHLFAFNSGIYKLAKYLIYELNPQIVFCSSDWHSMFEMYLLRLARKRGVIRITLQDTITNDISITRLFYRLNEKNNFRKRNFNKASVTILLYLRKPLLHFIVYWICPLFNLESPFFGKSSYILMKGNSGIRDSELHVVFRENYDFFLKSGVQDKKLLVNEHPIKRMDKNAIHSFLNSGSSSKLRTIVILISDIDIGFTRESYSIITEEEKFRERIYLIKMIASFLTDYNIIIKCHPNIKNPDIYKEHLTDLKNDMCFVPKNQSVEKYIFDSEIVVDLPCPNSSSIFFSTLMYPSKIIVCIDTLNELVGDYYKHYKEVNYLNSRAQVVSFFSNISILRDNITEKSVPDKLFSNLSLSEIVEFVKNRCR